MSYSYRTEALFSIVSIKLKVCLSIAKCLSDIVCKSIEYSYIQATTSRMFFAYFVSFVIVCNDYVKWFHNGFLQSLMTTDKWYT